MSTSSYRHPKHHQIVILLEAGWTDKAIAAELHVDRRASARVRGMLGIEPHRNGTTAGDKLDRFSMLCHDGHTRWTGRRNNSGGAPVIRQNGREIPAAAVAFERRTGRAPVGFAMAGCGFRHCLTPDHVTDDIERRAHRMWRRASAGLEAQPWTTCPERHSWDEDGRVEPDLTVYCRACATNRARAARTTDENGS